MTNQRIYNPQPDRTPAHPRRDTRRRDGPRVEGLDRTSRLAHVLRLR